MFIFFFFFGKGLNDFRPNDLAKRALEKSIQAQSDLIERCKIEGGFIEEERKFCGELFFELSKYLSTYEKDEINSLSALERAGLIKITLPININ